MITLEKFISEQQDQIINQTPFIRKSNIALQKYLIDCISHITKAVTEYKISLPENLEIIQLFEYLKEKNEKCQESGNTIGNLMEKFCENNNLSIKYEIPKSSRWW